MYIQIHSAVGEYSHTLDVRNETCSGRRNKTGMLKFARTQPAATTLIVRINIRQARDKIIFLELNIYRRCLCGNYYPRHSHYPHFYTSFLSSCSSWLCFVFIIVINLGKTVEGIAAAYVKRPTEHLRDFSLSQRY
jgi:hypothetical protein